jgi:hypothetical protein
MSDPDHSQQKAEPSDQESSATDSLDATGADVPEDGRIVRWSQDGRNLAIAWLVSGLLHSLGVIGFVVNDAMNIEIEVTFEESAGVALMSRLGYLDHQDDPDVGQPEEIAEEPQLAAEVEAVAEEPEPEPEELDAGVEEDALAEAPDTTTEPEPPAPDESDAGPANPQPVAENAADASAEPAETPEERRERQRLAREERERRAAEAAEAAAAAGPDMGLPPSQRYPEGTLNPIATDISMWGPEAARMSILIRNDRIRRNQHRDEIEQMLTGLPDWNTLAGGARIDPFDDVDAMLIATSNPRLINRTFFVGVHRIQPDQILRRLETGFPGGIRWEEAPGGRILGNQANPRICPNSVTPDRVCDPRVFLVPSRDIFIFTRPEFLADLQAGAPRARGLEDSLAYIRGEVPADDGDAAGSGEEEGSGAGRSRRRPGLAGLRDRVGSEGSGAGADDLTVDRSRRMVLDDEPPVRESGWVAGLRQIADVGGEGPDGPAFVMSAAGFDEFVIPGMGNASPPQQIHATGFLEEDPRVTGRLIFEDRDQAEAWVRVWPRILGEPAIYTALMYLQLYDSLNGIEWVVDHNEATFTLVIPRAVLERAALTVELANARRHQTDEP